MSQLTPPVPVVDLLGMLAYAELLAFDRMADNARLAPDLTRRAVLSEMAGSEIANYGRIAARLRELGTDPEQAMLPFRAALDDYHDQTQPSDWLEALTKAYVGDSIADDFVREVAQGLSPTDRDLVLDVLHDQRYADYAAQEIRVALAADPPTANRLSMWARRLVGEALTQAQRVAAERPALVQLLLGGLARDAGPASGQESGPEPGSGSGSQPGPAPDSESGPAPGLAPGEDGVSGMIKRLTGAHTNRMTAAGLNN